MRRALVLVVATALLAGCGGSGGGGKQAATATTATKTVLPAPLGNGCVSVPPKLLALITKNLTLSGAKLTEPRAVASPEVHGVWFVSAAVHGGGAGPHAVATWATKSITGGKAVFAVDDLAKTISAFVGGDHLNPQLDLSVRGARQSRACIPKAALGA